MMRHTGGRAVGDTSTRSSPLDCAMVSASRTGMTPICWPSSPITRTCGTRMRSFTRASGCRLTVMAHTSGWNVERNPGALAAQAETPGGISKRKPHPA